MTVGLSGAGFDLDLREGQLAEKELDEILRHGRVEVKWDKKCAVTGNLFVEYRQKGRPSGVAISNAEHWIFKLADTGAWVMLTRQRLIQLAREAYREGRLRPGGDRNRYDGVLIPVEWLLRPRITQVGLLTEQEPT